MFSLPDDLVLARVLHIFGATIWVGGLIFLMAVAVPFARTLPPESRVATVSAIGRRYRPIAWTALVILTTSGLYTMARMHLLSWALLTRTSYGRLLLFKIVLVITIIVLTALHDFVLGPRAHARTDARNTMIALARTSGALTLVVPVIGVVLAH